MNAKPCICRPPWVTVSCPRHMPDGFVDFRDERSFKDGYGTVSIERAPAVFETGTRQGDHRGFGLVSGVIA